MPSPVEFFDTVIESADSVLESTDSQHQDIELAGSTIRFSFASALLQSLLGRSFEHLQIDPGSSPDLTIKIWDSASTGAKMPPPPWSDEDYLARGEIRGFNDKRMRTAFNLGQTAALSMLDLQRGQALFWVRDAHSIPYYETGAPLRTIMYWWHSSRGYQLVHSGAVGTSDGGVLMVGRGGSGKSTSCLACLGTKLQYAGDDYCIVTPDPEPQVFSMYSTAKLKGSADLERFPELAEHASNLEQVGTEKVLFFLNEHVPALIISGFPLRAILVPTVHKDADAQIKRVSPAVALHALAPSSIFQNTGASHNEFEAMSNLVKALPCYSFVVGEKIAQIPEVIMGLLEELRGSSETRFGMSS